MTGKSYGYCRVSTDDQSCAVQREALERAGCQVILEETASGAKAANRNELQLLLKVIGPGDTVTVTKLDRLARNTLDMLTLIEAIGAKGAGFKSLAEPWCDTTSPAGRLMLTVFAGVAQFERERLRERQREGIVLAKARGAFKGSKRRFDPDVIRTMRVTMKPSAIAREIGCSEQTIFRALRTNTGNSHATAR